MGRPVLLTVDDDPAVSRAVARDLRRHYGEAYRVLRAGSGAEALEALRELKLRGDPVAVLLADHRMPEMNGIEFLERAMDLVPRARRALLTAYADTDAAIAAINDVDVDAYLLKPWDPPEEKLYPTVDAMLTAWHETPDPEVHGVKLVGHRWSAPSFRARDLLARNAVPYRWFDVDAPEGRRILAAAGAGPDDVPVVVTADAQVLRRPTEAELAAVAGLAWRPARSSTT
jgi:thioredoxin reductase (NADPH)